MRKHRVVAIAYESLCLFEYACAAEVFGLDRPEINAPWYRFDTCSVERSGINSNLNLGRIDTKPITLLRQADTIVVPGWRDINELPPLQMLKEIKRAHDRGCRVISICSGAFVLAAAGLLDGKRATTHWRFSESLSRKYPEVQVDAGSLYVDEGAVITSAGSAAGLDMLLHVVRKDYGSKVANVVAQRLVVAPHRNGGQSQFVPKPVAVDERGRLGKLMDWVRANPRMPHTLDSLAAKAAMSTRTLQRQFKDSTGLTPNDWLIRMRVGLAKMLLEESSHPLSIVADRSGFSSMESFRRHFNLIVGTSPTAYRQAFGTRYL